MIKNVIEKMEKETPHVFYERIFAGTGEQGSDIMDVVSRLRKENYLNEFL